jgi:hypothetical protein
MKRPRIGPLTVVIAIEVAALAAWLVLPAVRAARTRQLAEQAADDVRTVAAAASAARERLGAWPEDGDPGRTPVALAPFLPKDFHFERDGYSLDWDHWQLSDGMEPFSKRSEFLGVSVTARDARLTREIARTIGPAAKHFTVGNRSTVPISDPMLPTP